MLRDLEACTYAQERIHDHERPGKGIAFLATHLNWTQGSALQGNESID